MPIASGTHLGPYVVQESIGQGAMGVVYRAYHAQLERTGAVKVLQSLSPDEETTARFRREAQAIAHMRHPNVLNVFDFGDYEGTPYMIVEYVEGGTLAGRLKRASLTTAEALAYLRGIGEALDYAHSLGIVHRDVKPANVLIGPQDTPILADFGLAKLLQSSSIKSITGVTTGTPAYMAPEQVTGEQIGPAADRYSLAVMAFEMLSGTLPFNDAGVLEVLYAHVHRVPPKPSARNDQLTARVDDIILRGLAKDPGARWSSCEAFVSALEQAILPQTTEVEKTVAYPLSAAAVSSTVRAAPPVPTPVDVTTVVAAPAAVAVLDKAKPTTTTVVAPMEPPPDPESKRKRRRAVAWIGAAALILILLLGLTAAFIVGRAPRVDVTPRIVARGDFVRVTAANVPANQVGELQLHSVIHTFEFRASANGKVDERIEIPLDVDLGDHRLDLCWSSACRASTQIRVIAGGGVALASPTPSTTGGSSPAASPGSSPSPTPGTTPGKSPAPSSSPSSNPTHNPTPSPSPKPSPSPSPIPSPSPSPSVNPCPTPAAPATLKSSATTVVGGSAVTLTGASFTPNKSVTLNYYKGSATSPSRTWSVTASCAGGFSTSLTTAGGIARTDTVTACDSTGRCSAPLKLTIIL